jgi:HAD superfamily hydrolase (TIGR01549 family)
LPALQGLPFTISGTALSRQLRIVTWIALLQVTTACRGARGGRYNARVIQAVVFDVGETLVDESREYGAWADWLGVPRHSFSAVFGAVIALGRDHREAFQFFRPGFNLDEERARRAEAGKAETFGEGDLYPDARPAMMALRDMGLWVGVAGNQTSRAEEILRNLDLPADMIATSADWGASKPDPAFFRAVADAAPCPPAAIAYVGDRIDNDLKPARAAGMRPVFIRRGPWGYAWENHPDMATAADWRITTLMELPGLLAGSAAG